MSEIKRDLMHAMVGFVRTPAARTGARGTCVALLEDGAAVPDLIAAGTIGEATAAFVPNDGHERLADEPRSVIAYDGDLWGSGTEMIIGDEFFLQHVKYAVAPFVSIVGPTLVRIEDEEDFEMFLADADRAHEVGEFPTFLAAPPVQLADEVALGRDADDAGPLTRLFAGSDGTVRVSPTGSVLGDWDTPLEQVDARWRAACAANARPCGSALARAVPDAVRVEELESRPWIATYLDAVGCVRESVARGHPSVRLSGFGGSLTEIDRRLGTSVPPVSPLIAYDDELALVHQARTGTTIRMSLATARVVEILSWCGSVPAASAYVAEPSVRAVESALAQRGILVEAGASTAEVRA